MKRILAALLMGAFAVAAAYSLDGIVNRYSDGLKVDTSGCQVKYMNAVSLTFVNAASSTCTLAGVTPYDTMIFAGAWQSNSAGATAVCTFATTAVLTVTASASTTGTFNVIAIGK